MEIDGLCQTRNLPSPFALQHMVVLLAPGEQSRLLVYMAMWSDRVGQCSTTDKQQCFIWRIILRLAVSPGQVPAGTFLVCGQMVANCGSLTWAAG